MRGSEKPGKEEGPRKCATGLIITVVAEVQSHWGPSGTT